MADGAQTDAIEPAWNSCCDACSCSDAVRQQGWQTLQELTTDIEERKGESDTQDKYEVLFKRDKARPHRAVWPQQRTGHACFALALVPLPPPAACAVESSSGRP